MAILTISISAACAPSDQNLSKSAAELYDYICDTYGNAIISRQQESTWMTSEQFGEEKLCYQDNPEQFREVHFAKAEKRYEYLKDALKKQCTF